MSYVKSTIRYILPAFVMQLYHWCLAKLAVIIYRYPSEKLIVIGVTGTKGKSTTSNLIAQLLEMQGEKVGLTSTAVMKVGDKEWLSQRKMTMPGRFELQRLLRQMVDAGCKYAVVETSSEGLAQFRSVGIHYDVAVLTNFTPEHIEAHGGYENYRAAKGILFQQLKDAKEKIIDGHNIPKRVIIDPTISEYEFFSDYRAAEENHFHFGAGSEDEDALDLSVKVLGGDAQHSLIKIKGRELETKLLFDFNALNILGAVSACVAVGFAMDDLLVKVPGLKPVPGRQELIEEGQPFAVMVDYTYEPKSMELLFRGLKNLTFNKLIHVFGATGGGRDTWRRPVMGEISARNSSICIITMDDPYDDDPDKIATDVIAGAKRTKEELSSEVEIKYIKDRREAIKEAFALAEVGDLVLITGKGAEQKMAMPNGKYIKWDDREVAREELRKAKN